MIKPSFQSRRIKNYAGELLRRIHKYGGALPFFSYVTLFLFIPTIIVIIGAFQDRSGNPTWGNLANLLAPNTVNAFVTSFVISAVSAAVGAIVGAAAAYALIVGSSHNSVIRHVVLASSSVLAQFGGVMLAFAFLATLGTNGVVSLIITASLGISLDPNWLSTVPGLVTVYCYFQIPLMIIVFIPALEGIRPQWNESVATLGGSSWYYWRHVALPILTPPFLGAFLLLFANAFSSFATAAALFSQHEIIVPLMIQGALRNEMDTGLDSLAQVLALAMIGVVAVVMALHAILGRKARLWR